MKLRFYKLSWHCLLWAGLGMTADLASELAPLGLGLAATLVANVASYTVATQAFGDPFVLIFLGVITGFLLAQPTLADRHHQAVQARRASSPVTLPAAAPAVPPMPAPRAAGGSVPPAPVA